MRIPLSVIPAEAGIQEIQAVLDPGDPVPAKAGSRGDGFNRFFEGHQLQSSWVLLEDIL
jgi:hypothetical protein